MLTFSLVHGFINQKLLTRMLHQGEGYFRDAFEKGKGLTSFHGMVENLIKFLYELLEETCKISTRYTEFLLDNCCFTHGSTIF